MLESSFPRRRSPRRSAFDSMKQSCVYILVSRSNGTLYVGVTSNLVKRVWEHKNDCAQGFTKQYGTHMLVWFELHDTMENAIRREKQIKKWQRSWKFNLINRFNPNWHDLYEHLL